MKLTELHNLERLFQVNLFVHSLETTKPDGEDGVDNMTKESEDSTPEIAVQLIHSSFCHHSSTLYLNLYKNHFSYIQDMKKYAKSYCCSRCGTYWKDGFKLNRQLSKPARLKCITPFLVVLTRCHQPSFSC